MVELRTKEEIYERKKKVLGHLMSDKDIRGLTNAEFKSMEMQMYEEEQHASTLTKEEIDKYIYDVENTPMTYEAYWHMRYEFKKRVNYEEGRLVEITMFVRKLERSLAKEQSVRAKSFDLSCIDSCMRSYDGIFKTVKKFEWIQVHPYIYELAMSYYQKYNPHKKAGRKAKVEGRFIRMVDGETQETIDRFDSREAVMNYCGISKGNLSKCLKSVNNNQTDPSKWKSFKFEGVKYYFIPC